MGLQIYANIDRTSLQRGLVQSAANLNPRAAASMVAGDQTVVDVFLTGQDGLQNIQAYPTRRLGIGSLNARPTGGTWDLGSETLIPYNVSAEEGEGDTTLGEYIEGATGQACTVTALAPFVFKVVFTANGAQSIPTVDATGLTPSSTVNIQRLVDGDGSTQEEWLIRLFQNPIALIDASWTNITGSGIRGALNLGTEGVYDLLGDSTSVTTTIELELTDANGDIQTIFQSPITITGEVIGQGVTGVATFDNYVTSSQLAAANLRGNLIFVDAVNGDDSSGTAGRADLPFLTCNAAEDAASSGDTIVVRPGDYSGESALNGVDGVAYHGMDGSTLPAFSISTSITISGSGLCQSINCQASGAVINMPLMNTVDFISCNSGTVKAGNAGTFYGSVNTGTLILNAVNQTHDESDGFAPINLLNSGNVTVSNSRFESTGSGGKVIDIDTTWAGSLIAKNCELVATTVTTNEATTGILYGTSATGDVQLKDCTIITAQDGTGTAKSIDAPSAQTVYIQGTLSQTHDVDSDITLTGGASITNTNFTA